MWRGLTGTVALVGLALAFGAPAAPAATCAGDDHPVQSDGDIAAAEAAVVCLVDEERRSRGLPVLVGSERLDAAALAHSTDMVRRGYFAHTAPDPSPAGATADQRARWAGYQGELVRENLAGGLPVPRDLVRAWIQSEHHCENLLDPDVRDVGIGVAVGAFADTPGPAWTLLLGIERDSTPPEADGRPSAACPYADLGLGVRPVNATPPPVVAPPVVAPAPASAVLGALPPGPVLPQAAVRDLRIRWVDGLLQVTGSIRPVRKGHRVTVRVQRGKRVVRYATKTGSGGRFTGVLAVSPRGKGGLVKVTVAGIPDALRTITSRRSLPRAPRGT